MYQAGEFIVYGTSGVCKVEAVGKSPFEGEEDKLYYTLTPVAGTETIYLPVDSPVYTRPVITRAQAERLIAAIPSIERTTSLRTACACPPSITRPCSGATTAASWCS